MTPEQRYEVIRQRTQEGIRKLGWSTERLGAAVGVKKMQPSRWQNGVNIPSLEAAPALARILGVSLSYLAAAGEDEPEERAIDLLRQLGPAEKAAVVDKLQVWVEATMAARESIATPRKDAELTTRTPGAALVSEPEPASSPPGDPAVEFPAVPPRRAPSRRKRPPA